TVVVLTAAYRWGFWETVITGGIFLFVLLAEGLSSGSTSSFDLNWFVMRSMYLSLVSILIGYLAEQHKQIEQENSFITRLLRICHSEGELTPAIRTGLKISADFYRAKAALLVIQENTTHRVFRWQYPASQAEIGSRPQELDAEEAGK